MARSAAPDVSPIAPGSLLVSALVGIALAAAGFRRHDVVLVLEPCIRVRRVPPVVGLGGVGPAPQHRDRSHVHSPAAAAGCAPVPQHPQRRIRQLSRTGVDGRSIHTVSAASRRRAIRRELRAVAGRLRADRHLAFSAAHRQLSRATLDWGSSVAAVALCELRRILAGVRSRNRARYRDRDSVGQQPLPSHGRPRDLPVAAPHFVDGSGARRASRARCRHPTVRPTFSGSSMDSPSRQSDRGVFASCCRTGARRNE